MKKLFLFFYCKLLNKYFFENDCVFESEVEYNIYDFTTF